MILDKFPSADEFYKTYWGRKPFVVRGAIPRDLFDELADGDTLAGLSLDEDIKSRVITTSNDGKKGACEHGPFADDYFEKIDGQKFSLLVQNVEQYHTDTAKLLPYFNFAPRWLMDDIMISYSTPGGTVGAHTDSYHVFLVQGMGKRTWRVGNAPIQNAQCVAGQDLKVLINNFDGVSVDVEMGDVIYIPPHFAHEGITIDTAMTFSVGFLGPTIPEMLIEYGHYLEQKHENPERYCGEGLGPDSSGETMAQHTGDVIRNRLMAALSSDDFYQWMGEYFSKPTHDDPDNIMDSENEITGDDLKGYIGNGAFLYRPDHVKFITTPMNGDQIRVFVLGHSWLAQKDNTSMLDVLLSETSLHDYDTNNLSAADWALLASLYNRGALFLSE